MSIPLEDITGLVLAGGRGSRMGGVDKGLQNHHGMPLAMHALLRLQPQVGTVMINANRNLGAYEAMGVPVWPDAHGRLPGPAGRAGWPAWSAARRPTWSIVPCDTPNFPADLVARLAAALVREDAEIAMAATLEDGQLRRCSRCSACSRPMLLESLVQYLQGGERKIDRWTAQHRCVQVVFDDAQAFFNANTLDELQRLQPAGAGLGRAQRRASGALGDADGRELRREVLGLLRDLHRHRARDRL